MRKVINYMLFSLLLATGWMNALAQGSIAASPVERLKLTLVDNKSTYHIDEQKNYYENTLRLDQPDGTYKLTAGMLNQGNNFIIISRKADTESEAKDVARINLRAVMSGTNITVTPAKSFYSDNEWSVDEAIGQARTYGPDDVLDLSLELTDIFSVLTDDDTHPALYEYTASLEANIILPDPSKPVIVTPDSDIDMGDVSSVNVLVSGYYLTDDATITMTGDFSASPSTLTADQVNAGYTVVVSYTGSGHSGTGTMTITSGSVTRTVNITYRSAPPVIIAAPTTVTINAPATSGTFTVRGTDLAGPITINGGTYFNVSPSSISMDDAMAGNVTVTITPKSGIYTATTGTITLSSPEAQSVTVQVSYTPAFYASIDFSQCTSSDPNSAEIIGHNGWTLTNVTIYQPGNVCGYLRQNTNFTYRMPNTFTGNRVYVTVTSDTGSDGAGQLSVNNTNHTFTSGSSYTWTITVSAGGTITFAAPRRDYSVDISKVVISETNPNALNAPKQSQAPHAVSRTGISKEEITKLQKKQ